MRVIVCVGRDFTNSAALWSYLDLFGPPEITEIVSGMAKGADTIAADWAHCFGFGLLEFPADWKAHGRAAGPIRNQRMIDEGKPDAVIAFPGGLGTADTVRRAKKAGLPVYHPTGKEPQ
ncbi:DUF2493 domain-containing protein [Paracoccus saliphilus]|uniref:DUF2493 domain-containing protein n=1 Tax=Paracoccus saliphilus TaxID=405559 RepID=A0AA46A7N0_9RHOB|nr:DUF2493 domain-containing protein [Paracoccus saliphilus]WCR02936.1 DUF2493 domain-containing protein [Paracoccus saliphilus]SIT15856.1 Protein of unknown function [Paracoccus saliphilus]